MEEEEMLKQIVVAAAVGSFLFLSVCNPPVSAKPPIPITSFRLVANVIPGWIEKPVSGYLTGDSTKLDDFMNGGNISYINGGALEFSFQYLKKDSTANMDYGVIDFGTNDKAKNMFIFKKTERTITIPFGTHSLDSFGAIPHGTDLEIMGYYENYFIQLMTAKYLTIADAQNACELFITETKKRINQ
jgi:hypothetical protein